MCRCTIIFLRNFSSEIQLQIVIILKLWQLKTQTQQAQVLQIDQVLKVLRMIKIQVLPPVGTWANSYSCIYIIYKIDDIHDDVNAELLSSDKAMETGSKGDVMAQSKKEKETGSNYDMIATIDKTMETGSKCNNHWVVR